MVSSLITRHCSFPRKRSAFTLIEAMILMTIVSIVAVGAAVGLQSVVRIPKNVDNALAIDSYATSAMEQKIVDAKTSFSTVAGYADTITINGTSYARTVTVSALTAPDGSGPCTDYKQISVTIGNQTLITNITQP